MQNRFFELKKPDPVQEKSKTQVHFSKYLLAHYQKIENIERDMKRLPEKEEFIFLQTEKQFNAFTFIPFILRDRNIQHLYASTYSISVRVVESLMSLHDTGKIDAVTLLVSDSLIKRNPVTIDKIESLAAARGNVEIKYTWNHSKITLAKSMNDHFIIEGSGNWSENAAIEQYMFANSKALFDFRKQIFDEVI